MANQLASLPWSIDTPAAAALFGGKILVSHMEYVGYTDPNHTVEVQDENGNLVALLKGNADLSSVLTYKVGWISGILVPLLLTVGAVANLPSGKLLVYLR